MLIKTPGAAGTANAGYNPFHNNIELIKSPYISKVISDTAWYFLDLTKPIKPFVFQERFNLEVNVYPPDKHDDDYIAKTYERYRFGYGPWYLTIIGDL